MKKKIQTVIAISAMIFSTAFYGCEKKYEDGPAISLTSRTERIANTWIFAYAEEDGVNVSDQFDQYELYMNTEGEAELKASYEVFETTYSTTTTGSWWFSNEDEHVNFDYEDDSFDDQYKILRLMNDELWLKDLDRDLELHLLPK